MKRLEKEQAIALRRQGLSYREIQDAVPVSPGSLNRWLRDVALTVEQQAHLGGRVHSAQQRFMERNALRRRERLAQRRHEAEAAARSIAALSSRELHLVGTACYWAEGCRGRLTSVVEFVNADPGMVALVMRWFRESCGVPEAKFRARVQLHDPARREACEAFWSQVTGIPRAQFTRPITKISPTSQRKCGNILLYGTAHIRIADVRLLTRIQGWIQGLSRAPSSSPA